MLIIVEGKSCAEQMAEIAANISCCRGEECTTHMCCGGQCNHCFP